MQSLPTAPSQQSSTAKTSSSCTIKCMKIDVPAGKYIVAVSGGVDSVVLLDVLSRQKNLDLTIAHFDHGIRSDSAEDRKFVEGLAKKYDLPFEFGKGKLGVNTSEETARNARYEFLRRVKTTHDADAIITAHHQDDVLETILINLMRGTKRRGLSSLQSTTEILRPLIRIYKREILEYAKAHNLQWREDSTNKDPKYLRNWIRVNVMPKLSESQKQELLQTNKKASQLNEELEEILQTNFGTKNHELHKSTFTSLPHDVACEVMADWLRNNAIREFDQKTIERLVIGAKTLQNGKSVEIKKDAKMLIDKGKLKIIP